MTDGFDEPALARDMIEVHGTEASTVARDNARTAARAGQATLAKTWIRVLGVIQRHQSDKTPSLWGQDIPPPSQPATSSSQG
jgi:hypothetical protein